MVRNVIHLGHFPSRADAAAYRLASGYLIHTREIYTGPPQVEYKKFWRR